MAVGIGFDALERPLDNLDLDVQTVRLGHEKLAAKLSAQAGTENLLRHLSADSAILRQPLIRSGLLREPAGADFKRVGGEGESAIVVRSPEDLALRNNSAITHLVLLKDYHRLRTLYLDNCAEISSLAPLTRPP